LFPDFSRNPARIQANFPQVAAQGNEVPDNVKAQRTRISSSSFTSMSSQKY
jgi:hypothetical protein